MLWKERLDLDSEGLLGPRRPEELPGDLVEVGQVRFAELDKAIVLETGAGNLGVAGKLLAKRHVALGGLKVRIPVDRLEHLPIGTGAKQRPAHGVASYVLGGIIQVAGTDS